MASILQLHCIDTRQLSMDCFYTVLLVYFNIAQKATFNNLLVYCYKGKLSNRNYCIKKHKATINSLWLLSRSRASAMDPIPALQLTSLMGFYLSVLLGFSLCRNYCIEETIYINIDHIISLKQKNQDTVPQILNETGSLLWQTVWYK